MTLPVWQGLAAQESSGDIVVLASPSVTVTDRTTGAQPNLFSDRDGNTGIGNPFTANPDGSIEFYVAPGRYKVVATKGGETVTWDNQLIGTVHGAEHLWKLATVEIITVAGNASSPTDDAYSADLGGNLSDGDTFRARIANANETTTPTFENTGGTPGALTITTRDGSVLWPGALEGDHWLRYEGGSSPDTYLVLDPIPVIADSTEKTGADDKVVSGTAGTDGNLVQWNADGDAVDGPDVLDEDDMASDSDAAVPTQQSVKAFVETNQQVAQAWVNFDGTGTVSIRDHYNVSSITDNGTGEYDVNFSNALADANYAAATQVVATSTTRPTADWKGASYSHTTAKVSANVKTTDNSAVVDADWVQVIVLGGN